MNGYRFLHLIHRYYPFRGGSEQYFQALSERFAQDGADVRVITTDAWDLEYLWDPTRDRVEMPFQRHNGVRIYRTPASHLPIANFTHRIIRRGMGELSRVGFPGQLRLLREFSRFGPWVPELPALLERVGDGSDLVHAANIALEGLIRESITYARRRDIPVVVTPKLHLGESASSAVRRYYTMPHQMELLRQADQVMTQTSIEADFLIGAGVDATKLRVVGLGIDVDAVTGGDGKRAREVLGINGPIVLALGAAAFDKGTQHACEAVMALNQRRSDPISLVVAGPIMSNFQAFLGGCTPEDLRHVHVLGYVDDQMRTDLLAGCDVLTLASRTEAFGYVFLEAWANQKPVIGALAGGIPAVVDDQVDGLLVPFGDVAQLADSIEVLIDDSDYAAKLGERGSQFKVVDTEDWFQFVRENYAEVLGTATSGRTRV